MCPMGKRFSERAYITGGLGSRFPVVDLMLLTSVNGMRLKRFGA
jgi:hypothetical protein